MVTVLWNLTAFYQPMTELMHVMGHGAAHDIQEWQEREKWPGSPVDTVHASQLALKKALTDLDLARGEEELEKCQKELQEAKTKTDKAILVLQVLTKVNTELQYARAELEEALDKQEGDINEARKRGQPYTKPKKSHRSPERSLFQSRLGTASDSDSDEGFSRGQAQKMGRGRMNSSSESGSDYPAFPQQQRMGMADTPSSDGGGYMMAQQQYGAPGRGVAAESPISAVSDRSDMQEEGPASIQHMAPPPATATGGESPASMTESQSGTEFSGQEQGYYQNREEIPKEDTGISQAGEGLTSKQRKRQM
ncbi:hypothetical protein MAR_028997 [Mya arenaria]|uniref:Uncharacterized protein n=1 Tax=Mya arenaria TaxID=6604 RepID=A0ABY7DF75_MYAAR|nr:hypothetical protein MAR_028997 [Mya arenaria]